jgi:hypothetical protein
MGDKMHWSHCGSANPKVDMNFLAKAKKAKLVNSVIGADPIEVVPGHHSAICVVAFRFEDVTGLPTRGMPIRTKSPRQLQMYGQLFLEIANVPMARAAVKMARKPRLNQSSPRKQIAKHTTEAPATDRSWGAHVEYIHKSIFWGRPLHRHQGLSHC